MLSEGQETAAASFAMLTRSFALLADGRRPDMKAVHEAAVALVGRGECRHPERRRRFSGAKAG